ncbi:MAG: signal peptidase I [Coriobacteriales bacterium]|nr:signal peptidase I [Coriobacteriales bacterium]
MTKEIKESRPRPSSDEIASELKVRRRNKRILSIIGSTISVLLTVAAIVVLLATFVFPTLRIYGTSMTPTLQEGEVVVSVKGADYHTGDIIAFYYNNKILVKRVICGPGDWFNMQSDGTVYVNNVKIDEPYVSEPGFGSCDLELPYQVPDGEYFVMGDQRMSSIDSRMAQVGSVAMERIVGRVLVRVWPLDSISVVE